MNTHEKITSLIQVNLENFWKKMADTQLVSVEESKTSLFMNSHRDDPIFNSIIRFRPKEGNFESEKKKIDDYYKSKNLSYCWWTITPPKGLDTLSKQLITEGFTQTLAVKGMAMNIESFQWDGFLPEDIDIVEVNSSAQLQDWMEPIQASFDMTPEIRMLYIHIMTEWQKMSNDLLTYVMYVNGQPVSSFSVFFDKDVASFYNVATLPSFRKKRISSSIAACCLALSRQKKYQWVTLQASPYSVKLFERLGFKTYIDYVLRFK